MTFKCSSCGSVLTTHREKMLNVCSSLECQRVVFLQKTVEARDQKKRTRDVVVHQALQYVHDECPSVIDDSGSTVVMVVPGVSGEVAPQSAGRKARFAKHLKDAAAEAARTNAVNSQPNRRTSEYEQRPYSPPLLPVVNACSTCRGSCCRHGEDHAYLHVEFLAGRLLTSPDLTPDAMIEDYLQRLPEQSVEGSCLYHTESGCALPRERRSSACNDFLCEGIMDRWAEIEAQPTAASIAITECSDQYVRAGLMSANGERQELQFRVTFPLADKFDAR